MKDRIPRRFTVAVLAAAFWAVLAPPAHAYIDPGTGSYVFQVVIAALVAGAFSIKMFWRRIWAFFTRRSSDSLR